MARTSRTRSRLKAPITGKSTIFPNTSYRAPGASYTSTSQNTCQCTDSTGRPVVPSAFNSLQQEGYVTISARFRSAGYSRSLEGFPSTLVGTGGATNSQRDPIVAPNGWELTAIARSNPSRPVVTPPEVIQNIYQLPRLLRDTWNFLKNPKTLMDPKGAANAHLGVRFGWLPMIKDLNDIVDMQSHILKRKLELASLYSGKGLRRRLNFGSETTNYVISDPFSIPGASGSFTFLKDQTVKREAWATIRWKPTTIPEFHPQDMRYHDTVRNIVLGLTPEGMRLGAWKVIPWTWLIGWFTNVGSFLLVHSNTVPAESSEACFMSRSIVIVTPKVAVGGTGITVDFTEPKGRYVRVHSTRIVGGAAVPGLNMPFLGISQLSVLASLGAQRMLRGAPYKR